MSRRREILVSHRCADHEQVRPFVRALEAGGFATWYDDDDLRPGEPWLDAIARALARCSGVVVAIGAAGLGVWERNEGVAALNLMDARGLPFVPLLLPACPGDPLPLNVELLCGGNQRVDARAGSLQPDPAGRLVRAFGKPR